MADFFEYGFEKLKVYQLIRLLRVDLKKLTLSFPVHKNRSYVLKYQELHPA